ALNCLRRLFHPHLWIRGPFGEAGILALRPSLTVRGQSAGAAGPRPGRPVRARSAAHALDADGASRVEVGLAHPHCRTRATSLHSLPTSSELPDAVGPGQGRLFQANEVVALTRRSPCLETAPSRRPPTERPC